MASDTTYVVEPGAMYPRGFCPTVKWGWPLVKASKLVDLNYGKAMRATDRVEGTTPVYGTNGRCGWHNQSLVSGPGVILGRKGQGPLGVEWCDEDFWVIDTAYFVTPKTSDLDLRYFYYLTKYIGLNHLKDGTSNPSLSRDTFANLLLPLPSPHIQRSIARQLKTLDDKIELNRRMNETLESMARALFKSWFVDFDPVIDNALAAGNPIPEPLHLRAETRRALSNQTPSLSAHIKRLFPDDFRFDEEMGWIPGGWESIPVSKAITVNPRVSLKKGAVAKYVDMKALPTSGFAIDEVIEKAFSGGAKFLNSDVLMARITPCLENGKAGVVDYLGEDEAGFGSTEFIVLRPKGEIGTPFIAALVRDENFRSHCIANMVGSSGRQRVQNSCFDSYFLSLPSDAELLTTYDETCSAFFSRITTLKLESNALTKLRDTLLPQLLSGELRIPDAEQLVADSL